MPIVAAINGLLIASMAKPTVASNGIKGLIAAAMSPIPVTMKPISSPNPLTAFCIPSIPLPPLNLTIASMRDLPIVSWALAAETLSLSNEPA